MKRGFYILLLFTTKVYASYEAVPWTKNFLEIRPVCSLEYLSATPRYKKMRSPSHCLQGSVSISAAPYPNWEATVGVTGCLVKTNKLTVRIERQLLSDLTGSPVALTVVANASVSNPDRAQRPIFVEMASTTGELGIGCGRHIILQKQAYTQLFAYILEGIGSHQAKWTRGECGIQQVFYSKHFAKVLLAYTCTRGNHAGSFQGFGTVHTRIKGLFLSYTYRFSNGAEGGLSYHFNTFKTGNISHTSGVCASVSIPISL